MDLDNMEQNTTFKMDLKKRYILRIIFFFCFILITNYFVSIYSSVTDGKQFLQNYRLPENQEQLYLPFYIRHIEEMSNKNEKNILFIGSSPLYGIRIKNDSNTYPYSFKRAFFEEAKANEKNNNVLFYNISVKGMLVTDLYFLTKILIDFTDIIYIQLNYHTFNSFYLNKTKIRYPEIINKNDIPVSYEEAILLGIRNTPQIRINYLIESFLFKYFALYREREKIAYSIFGDSPKNYLYNFFKRNSDKNNLSDLGQNSSTPFDKLSPQKQMIILNRYSEAATFNIAETDTEIIFLKRLLAMLKTKNKKAVFFLAPINMDVLNEYEIFDKKNYKKNVSYLSNIIKEYNYPFIDINLSEPLESKHFFDISHTIDSGGIIFGEKLFKKTSDYFYQSIK